MSDLYHISEVDTYMIAANPINPIAPRVSSRLNDCSEGVIVGGRFRLRVSVEQ